LNFARCGLPKDFEQFDFRGFLDRLSQVKYLIIDGEKDKLANFRGRKLNHLHEQDDPNEFVIITFANPNNCKDFLKSWNIENDARIKFLSEIPDSANFKAATRSRAKLAERSPCFLMDSDTGWLTPIEDAATLDPKFKYYYALGKQRNTQCLSFFDSDNSKIGLNRILTHHQETNKLIGPNARIVIFHENKTSVKGIQILETQGKIHNFDKFVEELAAKNKINKNRTTGGSITEVFEKDISDKIQYYIKKLGEAGFAAEAQNANIAYHITILQMASTPKGKQIAEYFDALKNINSINLINDVLNPIIKLLHGMRMEVHSSTFTAAVLLTLGDENHKKYIEDIMEKQKAVQEFRWLLALNPNRVLIGEFSFLKKMLTEQ
jgi:hypothetical protein